MRTVASCPVLTRVARRYSSSGPAMPFWDLFSFIGYAPNRSSR